jgi:hypothetical protein
VKVDLEDLAQITREAARGPQISPAFVRELQREVLRLLELGATRESVVWAKETYLAMRSRIPSRRMAAIVVVAMLHSGAGQATDLRAMPEFVEAAA